MNEYKEIVLKNGMKLILVPSNTGVFTALIMFGVGSKHEGKENAGISHVLEHMAFKGTPKRPSGLAISTFVDSMGGEYNAFTGKEYTGYYVKATPDHLEDGFDFLSDILLNPLFDEEELEKEKGVITEEIKMYEDLPMALVEIKYEEAVFGNNDFGREIIGYRDTVKAVTANDLRDYKAKYYKTKNAVLVLAGNLGGKSDEEIAALTEKYFQFPEGDLPALKNIELSPKTESIFIEKQIEQANIVVGFRTVPVLHPDYTKLSMAALVLGGCSSSRMFEEVREKRGLAYTVRTSHTDYGEAGTLMTQAGVPAEKVEDALEAILVEYKKIKETPVPEEELKKVKEFIKGRLLIRYEDSEELAYHYAITWTVDRKIETPTEVLEKYSKINTSDILETAEKYFTSQNLSFSFVGKKIDEDRIVKLLHC